MHEIWFHLLKIFHLFTKTKNSDNEYINDFEAMLAKKKEEGSKRRKKRDIDIINDNDDIIDQLIQDMRAAAEVCKRMLPNRFIESPFMIHSFMRRSIIFSYLEYPLNRMIVN